MGNMTCLKTDIIVKKIDDLDLLEIFFDCDFLTLRVEDGKIVFSSDCFDNEDIQRLNNANDQIKTLVLDRRLHYVYKQLKLEELENGYRLTNSEELEEEGIKNYNNTFENLLELFKTYGIVDGYFKTRYENKRKWKNHI